MKTIEVNDQVKEQLDRLARQQRRNPSDVLEDLVRTALPERKSSDKGPRLDRLVNLRLHGPKDLAQNIDHYLYDQI
jgi:hypothetical protein